MVDQITVLQPHFLENKKALKRSSATGKDSSFFMSYEHSL